MTDPLATLSIGSPFPTAGTRLSALGSGLSIGNQNAVSQIGAAPAPNPAASLTGAGSQTPSRSVSSAPNPLLTPSPVIAPPALKVGTPPVSPISQKPVTYGGGIVNPATGKTTAQVLAESTAAAQAAASAATGGSYTPEGGYTPGQSNPVTLANGSTVSTDGNGNVTSPSSFAIDTTGAIPSSALNTPFSASAVTGTRQSYADYVNGLSQASQYSPEYVSAVQAQLAANQKELSDNVQGQYLGDTTGFAQGATARMNLQDELSKNAASNTLQVQELIRQGNIAAATALVNGTKPESVSPGASLINPASGAVTYGGAGAYSDYQAQQTYFNLAQNFPDAQIPSYNPSLSAQQNLQVAQQAAASAPSFQSRNLMQVTDAAGGIHFVNKNQLQTNPDGSYTYISPTTSAGNKADAASLTTQQSYADTITRSLNTADTSFQQILGLMGKAKINDAQSPILNQLNNQFKAGVIGNGDVVAFQSAIADLRAEYSQVLAKGGVRSVETDNAAKGLIPDTLSLNDLRKVQQQISTQGAIAVKSANDQIAAIKGRINTSPTGSGASVNVGNSKFQLVNGKWTVVK